MPTAPVNDTGAAVYYEDSGAPGENISTYVTFVIIHGLAFHGASFMPMISYAASHNLRIIAINLRDYPGSSPYTDSELELLCSSDIETQREAVRAQGREIAALIKYLVLTEDIPPLHDFQGKKSGGIVLLSWSFGNVWSLSMFGNVEYSDAKTQSIIKRYLRSLVMYVPPHQPLGVALPEELYLPIRDPSVESNEQGATFGRWVSAFYTPQHELTGDISVLARRVPMHEISSDHRYVPTVDLLSPDELASIVDPGVLQRSARCIDTTDMRVWWDNAHRALFDIDTNGPLSHVNVLVLWCDMGAVTGPFVASHIADRLRDAASAEGRTTRKMEFVKIEQANHFIHWHEPERFIKIIVENLIL